MKATHTLEVEQGLPVTSAPSSTTNSRTPSQLFRVSLPEGLGTDRRLAQAVCTSSHLHHVSSSDLCCPVTLMSVDTKITSNRLQRAQWKITMAIPRSVELKRPSHQSVLHLSTLSTCRCLSRPQDTSTKLVHLAPSSSSHPLLPPPLLPKPSSSCRWNCRLCDLLLGPSDHTTHLSDNIWRKRC